MPGCAKEVIEMAEECPKGGKHNWQGGPAHMVTCSKCGESRTVY